MNRLYFFLLVTVVIGGGLFANSSLVALPQESDAVQESENEQQEPADDSLMGRVRQLIVDGEIREARNFLEGQIAADPDNVDAQQVQRSFALVAAGFNRIRNGREVFNTLQMLLDFQLGRIEQTGENPGIAGTIRSLIAIAPSIGKQDEIGELIDAALQAVAPLQDEEGEFKNRIALSNLRTMKALDLLQSGNREQAAAIHEKEIAELEPVFENHAEDELVLAVFARSLSGLMRMTDDEQLRQSVYERHQAIMLDQINAKPENMSFATQYVGGLMFMANQQLASDPQQVVELMDEAEKILSDLLVANPDSERPVQPIKLRLALVRRQAEGRLNAQGMVGSEAVPLQAEFWVNGEDTTIESLRGQVILLEFWAVWSKQCVDCLPTLKELHTEYADRGLTVIGVTSRYNLVWNDETDEPQRSRTEVDPEAEVEIIQRFMDSNELPYRTAVLPGGNETAASYFVTSVPHFVLVDKQGKIRMVKIGSDPANFDELETMVEQLLDE